MADAAPAHVGDVEQPVNAVQVNERAEIGDILDGALADVAGGHFGQELGPLVVALLFDKFPAGKDDVLAVLIDFDDLVLIDVADELRQVFWRHDVNL